MSIAVLLTCFNRKKETLACLEAVFSQRIPSHYEVKVYLTDDGSSDGTGEAVKQSFPDVEVLNGDGSLYWNGGMRVAFQAAMEIGYDYYFWLNDDTHLYSDAFERLLALATNSDAIIAGSVCDPISKEHTYGGIKQVSRWLPLKFKPIKPDMEQFQHCDTFNGNCVLIPAHAVEILGNLDAGFTHSVGDFDYGLRAKKHRITCLVAQGYFGECARNPIPDCFNKNVPLAKRWRALHSPKGLPPKEWITFTRRYTSLIWPIYLCRLYLRMFKP
ncbi:glycosyltransferase family 2 protein [bacterium AH-315-I20]|nr:glycosyltransferase family 2 protein [bacterium AH-315-I20]